MNAQFDNFYKNKHILITGGLGFIGSNLAIKLIEIGANVTIVDSLIPEYGGNLFNIETIKDHPNLRINIADVRDRASMNYLVKSHSILFNLAGQVSHIDSMHDPFTDLDINCMSQLSLLEACRINNPDIKIVYAGTRQVYGKPKYLPVDENHLLQPTDVNGINMMAGERYHILYNNVHNIRACSLRMTNTYGPRQLIKHNKHGFVGIFIRLALQGETLKIFGDGKQRRDFNYVDDVVKAMLLAGSNEKSNGKIYNLGHKKNYSLLDFAQILGEHTDVNYAVIPFPEDKKKIDIGDYYSNFEKIQEELGWEPKFDLQNGLEKTVKFYRENFDKYVKA